MVRVDLVKELRKRTIKVRLHRKKEFLMRLWVAKQLFYLAAWVLNCGIDIAESELE